MVDIHRVASSVMPVSSYRIQRRDAKALPTNSADSSKSMIRKVFEQSDDEDITAAILKVSLICPVSQARIDVPCRSVECSHLRCFDAVKYLGLVEHYVEWFCPICGKRSEFRDLYIDSMFSDVLRKCSSLCEEVCFYRDSSWSEVAKKFSKAIGDGDAEKVEIDHFSFLKTRIVRMDCAISTEEKSGNLNS